MAAADAEIEKSFRLSREDILQSRELDRDVAFERLPPEKKRVAAYQRAYREANREENIRKARERNA